MLFCSNHNNSKLYWTNQGIRLEPLQQQQQQQQQRVTPPQQQQHQGQHGDLYNNNDDSNQGQQLQERSQIALASKSLWSIKWQTAKYWIYTRC